MSELNLNWFVKNSTELFPGDPDPVLPLRETCVQVVNGKRVVVCAMPECPAVFESNEPIADDATYICKEHNPKPAQGVFFQRYIFGSRNSSSELRNMFDRNEPFMMQGNQPAKTREVERKWTTPEWMFDNDKVAALLNLHFPKIVTEEQKQRVAKWVRVFHLYFRMGLPAGERDKQTGVDAVMNWQPGTAESIVQKIRRMLQGRQANGKMKSNRARGRPKKVQPPDCAQVIPDSKA